MKRKTRLGILSLMFAIGLFSSLSILGSCSQSGTTSSGTQQNDSSVISSDSESKGGSTSVSGSSSSSEPSETVTVVFDCNGGVFSNGNITAETIVQKGDSVSSPDEPTLEGCTFIGWTSIVDNEETLWNFDDSLTSDLKLYALWEENFIFTEVEGGYSVSVKNIPEDGKVEIPGTYKEKPVIAIAENGFFGFSSLTSIVIPDSVTNIGSRVFEGCSSLENMTLPNMSLYLGYYFGASSYSYNSEYVPTSLKEVIITGGTSIESNAFYGCNSLTSIMIPNSVTSIGSETFRGCSSLVSITVPDSVTNIGNSAFFDCISLKTLTFESGSQLTGVGDKAFANCISLENVYYAGTIENWCGITFGDFANPMYYGQHFYLLNENNEYEEVTEIVLPNTITSIGQYQFYGFNNITSVVFPESVNSIGKGAFSDCSSLTSIVIPDSVTSIGDNAFASCSSLTSIVISDSVTSMGDLVFTGCGSLTIYCEASSQPSGWKLNWNLSDRPVYWSGEWSYMDGVPTPNVPITER